MVSRHKAPENLLRHGRLNILERSDQLIRLFGLKIPVVLVDFYAKNEFFFIPFRVELSRINVVLDSKHLHRAGCRRGQ